MRSELGPEEIQAPDLLAALAGALWWVHRSKLDVSGPLAEVMARPALCRQIGAGMQSPFGTMIYEYYEYKRLETLLEELDDPAIETHLRSARMLAVLRVRDFVQEALLRPRLRAGLAEVLFASPTPRLLAEDLDMICTALPLTMWDRDAFKTRASTAGGGVRPRKEALPDLVERGPWGSRRQHKVPARQPRRTWTEVLLLKDPKGPAPFGV